MAASAETSNDSQLIPRTLPPRSLRSFVIRYQQALLGPSAGYMVTSARRWPQSLDRAAFVVDHPAEWKDVRVSYPVRHRETHDGRTTLLMVGAERGG